MFHIMVFLRHLVGLVYNKMKLDKCTYNSDDKQIEENEQFCIFVTIFMIFFL